MPACHGVLSAVTLAAHPDRDRAVWFCRTIAADGGGPWPGARSATRYCRQKDRELFKVFVHATPQALCRACPKRMLLLTDEVGSGAPLPQGQP